MTMGGHMLFVLLACLGLVIQASQDVPPLNPGAYPTKPNPGAYPNNFPPLFNNGRAPLPNANLGGYVPLAAQTVQAEVQAQVQAEVQAEVAAALRQIDERAASAAAAAAAAASAAATAPKPSVPSKMELVETGLTTKVEAQVMDISNNISRPVPSPPVVLLPLDENCAMCQYWVQRMLSSIISSAAPTAFSFAEVKTSVHKRIGKVFKAGVRPSKSQDPVLMEMGAAPAGKPDERRYLEPDMLAYRPWQARYDPTNAVMPDAEAEQRRALAHLVSSKVYTEMSNACLRAPPNYLPPCRSTLSNFQKIFQGLMDHGERPDMMCLHTAQCTGSYLEKLPHTYYKPAA